MTHINVSWINFFYCSLDAGDGTDGLDTLLSSSRESRASITSVLGLVFWKHGGIEERTIG